MKQLRFLRNLKDELFTPYNSLRVLGMICRKVFIGPLKVTIDITNKCDMNCIMCWYHSPHLLSQDNSACHMHIGRFKDLIKELKKIKTKIVLLTGEGEPLLHPHIEEMIEFIRKNSLEAEIMTNGYYLDREKIEFFKKVGIKKILVSLHACDEHTFRMIHPLKTENDFKKTMDNLLSLKSLRKPSDKLQFFIINVISSLNCNKVFDMAKLAQDLKADKVIFKPLTLKTPLPESLGLSLQDKKELILNLKRALKITTIPNNIKDYAIFIKYSPAIKNSGILAQGPESINYPFFCYIPWVQSVIRLNEVLGCVYANDCNLGNIYKNSFIDIWFGKKYKLFRKGLFCHKKCLGRTAYPLLS